jgi:hypothetical protein
VEHDAARISRPARALRGFHGLSSIVTSKGIDADKFELVINLRTAQTDSPRYIN